MKSKFFMILLLVIVVVGIIIVAVFIKSNSPADSDRASMVIIFQSISLDAKAFYNQKGTFNDYEIPDYLRKSAGGKVREKSNDQSLSVVGIGQELGKNGISHAKVEAVITKSNTSMLVKN